MNEKISKDLAAKIRHILGIFWSRKLMIAFFAIVALIPTYIRINYFTPDIYATDGLLYVSNRDEEAKANDEDDTVYSSDMGAARMMNTTYVEVLTTRSFREEVSKALNGKYSAGQIAGMLTISIVNESELLQVSVQAGDPQAAYDVATAAMAAAPHRLSDIFEGGEVKVVEEATLPTAPIGRNSSKGLLGSALVGIALGCALAFLLDYFDTKIHSGEDIAKRYNVSILGEIPQ